MLIISFQSNVSNFCLSEKDMFSDIKFCTIRLRFTLFKSTALVFEMPQAIKLLSGSNPATFLDGCHDLVVQNPFLVRTQNGIHGELNIANFTNQPHFNRRVVQMIFTLIDTQNHGHPNNSNKYRCSFCCSQKTRKRSVSAITGRPKHTSLEPVKQCTMNNRSIFGFHSADSRHLK